MTFGATFARMGRKLSDWRGQRLQARLWNLVEKPGVLSGPFKGLRYPSPHASGSAIWPKLLGTYESELHPTLWSLADCSFDKIVDVGAAEGYYAVGLARLFDGCPVFAFDINSDAQQQSRKIAKINDVSQTVTVCGECDSKILSELVSGQRCFVICDCEGFEKTLFDDFTAQALCRSDLIIEVHDFVDSEISAHLKRVFKTTHDVEVVDAVSEDFKARNYCLGFCIETDYWLRRTLLSEGRPSGMKWFVFRSRKLEEE